MRISVVLILLLAPSLMRVAVADMYRCPAKDGSVTYSDMPCSPSAERIQGPKPSTPAPQPTITLRASPDADMQGKLDRQRMLVDAKGREIRQRETVSCESREYNDWIRGQNPLPDKDARLAKLSSVQDECRKIYHFTDADAAAYSAPAGH